MHKIMWSFSTSLTQCYTKSALHFCAMHVGVHGVNYHACNVCYICTTKSCSLVLHNLMLSPWAPPSEKQSGEWSWISWAYSPKVVRTNEITRLVIIMYHLPYNNKYLYLSIRTFLERVWHKMFWALLGYTVASACKPKKFDFLHQTVSPGERVGSGDKTKF